jgi:hypothetical protein
MEKLSDWSLDRYFGLLLVKKVLKIMAMLNGFWISGVFFDVSAQLIKSLIGLLTGDW